MFKLSKIDREYLARLRMTDSIPASEVPPRSDYTVTLIRESLRDRQAAMACGALGGGL